MSLLLLSSLLACAEPPAEVPPSTVDVPTAKSSGNPGRAPIIEAFPPPAGAERVQTDAYGEDLRNLTVLEASAPVKTWDGRVVGGHEARVIDLPMVDGDLQQCADSIIRLRAEYQRARGDEVMFHATSGDPMPWARYKAGESARADGNKLVWRHAAGMGDERWDSYLRDVFRYAGTASLEERETVSDDVPDPGDMLVEAGFPGHAVVVLDVARRGEETFVLVGEGFMPAQNLHVELGPVDGWWDWKDGVPLPHWTLGQDKLRRWK